MQVFLVVALGVALVAVMFALQNIVPHGRLSDLVCGVRR